MARHAAQHTVLGLVQLWTCTELSGAAAAKMVRIIDPDDEEWPDEMTYLQQQMRRSFRPGEQEQVVQIKKDGERKASHLHHLASPVCARGPYGRPNLTKAAGLHSMVV